ncbi:hypothetical protein J4211_04195 [Candidatus Woesearchaeota archaeon]|nr:hypothetical protein [Candidatus Woesearchaeota archaeon]
MARRGRPVKSEIRQNIVEMLHITGPQYGYQIHKFYNELFPGCTRENIYYNLRKGVTVGEFELSEIKQEKGAYSWGTVVEKKYYKLGPKANVKGIPRVEEFFVSLKKKK